MSDALSEQERAMELPIAGHTIALGKLVDATAGETGMRMLAGFASKPGRSWSAHQIVTQARASLIDAGIASARHGELRDQIELHVADGLGWLIARGLVGPAAEHSGAPHWRATSDGLRAAEHGSADHVDATLRLHAELHPALDGATRSSFERGEYAIAAFAATHSVEVAVREAAGLDGEQYGVKLMRDAFKPGGPLAANGDPVAEQEGVRDLFVGMVGAFKNPSSHRVVQFDSPIEAANVVHLADTLLRVVDRAKKRNAQK